MWADPYDLAGLGEPMTAEQVQMLNANYSPEEVARIVAGSQPDQVAVAPTTEAQIFNLINTVAKGLLDVQQTQAQTKLSTAQIAANAEASKVQAQNYVMQQLQQGKQVMVPESWLQKYSASDTMTKWLTPILIIGGIGLLGYALYKYTKGAKRAVPASSSAKLVEPGLMTPTSSLSEADAAMAASNPRRRRHRRRHHRR